MTNSEVTLRDILDVQNRVENKIDNFRKEINKKFDGMHIETNERFNDVDKRIDKLEQWKENLSGKITMAIGIISIAFNVAWEFVKEKFGRR